MVRATELPPEADIDKGKYGLCWKYFLLGSLVYKIYGCLAETISRESSHLKPTFSLPKGHLCSPRGVFLGEMISC